MKKFNLPKILQNKKVRTSFREEIELHDILVDRLARKKTEEMALPDQKMEVLLPYKSIIFLCGLFSLLFLVLVGRTYYLQFILHETLSQKGQKNYERIYYTRPNRGVIYDKEGNQLVFNRPSYDLLCFTSELPKDENERREIILEVSETIKESFEEISEKINKAKTDPILIAGDFDHETLVLLETKMQELKGFRLEQNIARDYKDGPSFSKVIGFCGRIGEEEINTFPKYSMSDYVGKSGVEKFYEDVLRGVVGETIVQKDAFGNEISRNERGSPIPGNSLVLWLDAGLQQKLEQELSKRLAELKIKKAAAVAIDPRTGGVLAMVSLPNFDNNIFSGKRNEEELEKVFSDPDDPLFNKTISGFGYPTGSAIKPLIAAAALEEGIISPITNIFCRGLISVENQYWPENEPEYYTYKDWRTHNWTDLYKAIAESCNVFFYTIGGGYEGFKGLGPENIKKYIQLFGWGNKTGIDLPGEDEGILPVIDKNWRLGDTYHFSIGQGKFSVTPLQVANAYAAIANGGILYKPHIVKQIIKGPFDAPEETMEINPEIVRQNFIGAGNLKEVRKGMRQTVTSPSGSTYVFNNLPVACAAKTGTAQTGKPGFNHAWVSVFAPYENPEIVLTIVVENAPEDQVATLPVAKEVLRWYFAR